MNYLIPIEEIIELILKHERLGPPFKHRLEKSVGFGYRPHLLYWFEKEDWYPINFTFRIDQFENGFEDSNWSVEAKFKDHKFLGEIRNIEDNGTMKVTYEPA